MMTIGSGRGRYLVIGVFALLAGVVGSSQAQEATPIVRVLVLAPDEPTFGASLAEWSARHWQWTTSLPIPINPGHDVTGVTCGYGQSGPVFFIPRNFPPCTVPAGVALLVPIAGTVCSTVEPPPYGGRDEAELRACAATEVDRYTGIVVRVDGQAVPDIEAYRASSPRFTMTLPEHNVLGVPAGVAYAVADGYQVMVAPLPVGEHETVAHVELTDGTVLPDKVLRVAVVEPLGTNPGATPDLMTPRATPVM
jgi:hypothetical protein